MTKNTKIAIGVGLLAVVGYYMYSKKKAAAATAPKSFVGDKKGFVGDRKR
jgi:hypothetical protein